MGYEYLLPQIVRLPQIRAALSVIPPIRREILTEDMLIQKAEEVNLLDYLQLVFLADRVEVYLKVGEVEG